MPLANMIHQNDCVKCTLTFISRRFGDLYRRLGDSDCIRKILGYSRRVGIDVLIKVPEFKPSLYMYIFVIS